MPTLQVREVPVAIYDALAKAASHEHRSLAQQTLVTLERGLGLSDDRMLKRKNLVERLAAENRQSHPQLPDPVRMIREDRER
jgi:hypothetical protein